MSRKQKKLKSNHTITQTVDINQYKDFYKPIELLPRNTRQEEYICNLQDYSKSLVFATGPAGTGKTMLAVLAAVQALKEGDVAKLIVTRPVVEVEGEKLGFLPGDIQKKMDPWTRPIFDVLQEHFSSRDIKTLIEEGVIEISPLAYMRGRTFKNALILADEMQNSTPNQMKMLLTRLGEGSRMFITGDIQQTDRRVGDNGLLDFKKLLAKNGKSDSITWTEFAHADIERHPAVAEVLKIYGEE